MSDEPQTTDRETPLLAEWRTRFRPTWGFGALALLFIALFAWSELRLREAREQLSVLEAANRALGEERRRFDAAANAAGQHTTALARTTRVVVLEGASGVGRLYVNDAEKSAVAVFVNLPPIPMASRYHLWLRAASGGELKRIASFTPQSDHSAHVILSDISFEGTPLVELTAGSADEAKPSGTAVLLSGTL